MKYVWYTARVLDRHSLWRDKITLYRRLLSFFARIWNYLAYKQFTSLHTRGKIIKEAYIAIQTSDQNVEIFGTNRLQKYSRFRVSSERATTSTLRWNGDWQTAFLRAEALRDRTAYACRVAKVRCGKSYFPWPSLPLTRKNLRLLGASSWMNWIVNEHGCKVPLLLNFVIKFCYCWQPNVEDYHLCILSWATWT